MTKITKKDVKEIERLIDQGNRRRYSDDAEDDYNKAIAKCLLLLVKEKVKR